MVQRKAPQKLGVQAELKRSHVKLERQVSSNQQQDTRSKGGAELRKMMKIVRSIKAADLESLQGSPAKPKPNYMKPTSSSDARKEKSQVTIHSKTTNDMKRNPRNSKRNSSSKPSSYSPSSSSPKPSKLLNRQSSLKAVRPLMKKNSKSTTVNEPTCSSTLKDSKFPKVLDLHPGGTEGEVFSIMKVCPYTYCFLNGHRHASQPPLSSFLSARRSLLKTQKSMKVKGVSPFKMKGSGKAEKEIDTRQTDSNQLTEDAANEFFIEIYSKRQEHIVRQQDTDERRIQIEASTGKNGLSDLLMAEDVRECADSEVEEVPIHETYSDVSFEDEMHQKIQNSEVSFEKPDVVTNFPQYVEGDVQVEKVDEEYNNNRVPEDYADLYSECFLATALNKVSTVETTDIGWEEVKNLFPDDQTECSDCPGDGSISPSDAEFSINSINNPNAIDVSEVDIELPQVYQEAAENGDAGADDELSINTPNANVVTEADVQLPQVLNQEAAENGDAKVDELSIKTVNTSNEKGVPEADVELPQDDEFSIKSNKTPNANDAAETDVEFKQEMNQQAAENGDADADDEIKPINTPNGNAAAETSELPQDLNKKAAGDAAELFIKSINILNENDVTGVELPQEVNQKTAENDDKEEEEDNKLLPEVNQEAVKNNDKDETDNELLQEVIQEDLKSDDARAIDRGRTEDNASESDCGNELSGVYVSDLNSKPQEAESPEENYQGVTVTVEGDCFLSSNIGEIYSGLQGCEVVVSEEPDEGSETGNAFSVEDIDESTIPEPDVLEAPREIEHGSVEEKENNNEVRDTSSLFIVQQSSGQELRETDADITEGDCIGTESAIHAFTCYDATEDTTVIPPEVEEFPLNNQSDRNNIENQMEPDTVQQEEVSETGDISKSTAMRRTLRQRTTEEVEQMRDFNPRPPRVLPLEPDPEEEKVDLRHQMMDDKKNAEEWMIDYALQQAVTKLTPAKKKKVELLVEAFETVMPLPMYEKPMRHSTSGFTHARFMQACT